MENKLSEAFNSLTTNKPEQPVCLIVIGNFEYGIPEFPKKEIYLKKLFIKGMAGAGKTSFVQRLNSYLHSQKKNPYVINLDPACHELPYPCNIDIRDTVNYKEVMKQYSLGPNGAIMTSLNLFSTKFNQIIELIEKRSTECKYVLIDTPGQIEVFTWSASGSIITESLASTFPSIIVYVMDTSKSINPITFMSNMLYACSILYKSKLPFIIVMNKNDIIHHSFVGEWITNFDSFQNALESETSYMSNLTRSLSLVLDEFYQNINFVGVSSMTGDGFADFLEAVHVAEIDYEKNYKCEYEKFKQKKLEKEQQSQEEQLKKFEKDFSADKVLGEYTQVKLTNKPVERRKAPEIYSNIQKSNDETETRKVDEHDDDQEEEVNDKLELESFKRFLDHQKK